ncbi:hypothetical protein JG688_00010983 [Phytophthora aleatoria]|uniref:Arb2 domain-containing protein n=1 Tax=Phytophthora aleatoria TaxID=2496075 RepID=A0A8J5M303_9STRA|nr:hypothetical protein JG688_00010983 [Phytophthora aleatoria]
MKKSPVAAMSNIREAVRRKSVGLSFTTNFSIFSRGASSTGEDDRSEHEGDDYNDDSESSRYNRSRQGSVAGEDDPDSSPSPAVSSRSSYVEPPEPPLPPPGGLLEAATKNVQGKMQTLMETFHEVTTSHDDETIQCSVFLSRTALFSDRLVVFIGDSDGSPAGIWSARLCVRSGSEGGGIFKGSLGSMLPYIMKAKEDKLGIVLFDDIFKDSMRSGEIDIRSAVQRFMTGWRNHVLTSRATHVFIVAYRDGGNLLVEALRSNMKEMQRHISGVAFLQSTHHISSDDTYTLRKMIAQWCLAYMSSPEGVQALKRMKPRETPLGCVVLSAGRVNSDVDVLQTVVSSVYASFKARWSGFRVKNQGTIHEDEEFVEEDYIEESGDGDGVPLSPGSKENSMTSSKASPSKANGSDTPPASSSAASASPRSPQSVGSPSSPPPAPMSPGSPEGSAPCTPTEPQSQTI